MKVSEDVTRFLDTRLLEWQFLVLDITSGGCTGLQASFRLALEGEVETLSTTNNPKVFVHQEAEDILKGASLGVRKDLVGESLNLVVDKQLYEQCGCGSSFIPKDMGA